MNRSMPSSVEIAVAQLEWLPLGLILRHHGRLEGIIGKPIDPE